MWRHARTTPPRRRNQQSARAPGYDDLLQRISDLEAAAERAMASSRLEADEAALLRRKLNLLAAAFDDLKASEARTLQGERQALRDRDEAQRTNRAKTELLAAAGHDLRQPLMVLAGTLDLLAPHLPKAQRPVLERGQAAARRLERSVASLRDAARLEYGGVTPALQTFRLDALVDEVREQHQRDAERNGIGFKVAICRWEIVSDLVLLGAILHNLIGNAIKYTKPGGRVLLGCRPRGKYLLVQMWDTGIGIPPEMQDAIFAEFRQLDARRSPGIGLGLTIAKRAADLLRHPLTVRSAFGRGSCFAIDVPLA